MLSVILPAYNEEKMIPIAARRVGEILKTAGIPYELIFVNDGSSDGTWKAIEKAHREEPRVAGICLSRNF